MAFRNSYEEGLNAALALLDDQFLTERASMLGTREEIGTAKRWRDTSPVVREMLREQYPDLTDNELGMAIWRGEINAPRDIVDFEGNSQIDYQREIVPELMKLREEFGVPMVELSRAELEASDPEAFALREKLGEDLLGDGTGFQRYDEAGEFDTQLIREDLERMIAEQLSRGGELDPEVRREIEQSVRNRQAMNGPGAMLGDAATFQEAMQIGQQAEARRDKRLAQALSFLQGGQTTQDNAWRQIDQGNLLRQQDVSNQNAFVFGMPLNAQFGNLSGAQTGANPTPFLKSQADTSGASSMAVNYDMNAFNQAQENYRQQQQIQANKPNEAMQWASLGIDALGSVVGGAAAFCWVARAVYGPDDPRWLQFRQWMLHKAPDSLRNLYCRRGPRLAERVERDPDLRAYLRSIMDQLILNS
ncbi:MAG: hypothetical protein AAFX93_17165 [Verrucomicrobiota bacterium]